MVVSWEPEARDNLKGLFAYYREVAGLYIAIKIRTQIMQTVAKLSHFPFLGAIEADLGSHIIYRSILAYKHYKVFYRIENRIIFVAAVWDVRQNPDQLRTLLRK